MQKHKGLSRREFMRYSAMAAAVASFPGFTGCARIPRPKLERLDSSKEIVLIHANLIDVGNAGVIPDATIRIFGGRFVSVEQGTPPGNPYAEVIDLDGKWVTPGFIDGHCHLTASPVFGTTLREIPKHIRQQKMQFVQAIASGVTTARDTGSFSPILHGIIRDIEKGDLIGPRVVFCNAIINLKGSHPDIDPSDVSRLAPLVEPFMGMIQANFTDMESLTRALEKNARDGAFIKLTVDNKSVFCRKGEIPVYSDEQLRAIFDFAEKRDLPVVCHHHRKWGFDRMLHYPIHCLEHQLGDAFIPDEQIEEMARKKIATVPTLAVAQSFLVEEAYDELPEAFRIDYILREIRARNDYLNNEGASHYDPEIHWRNMGMMKLYKTVGWEHLWERKLFLVDPDLYFGVIKYGYVNLKKMKDAGVLIGCGIDAGMPFTYFGGLYREFEIYERIGFSIMDILRCVTMNNARILRMADRIGSVDPGKLADMVVFARNPLEDIKVLRSPMLVFKEGRLMHATSPLNRVQVPAA